MVTAEVNAKGAILESTLVSDGAVQGIGLAKRLAGAVKMGPRSIMIVLKLKRAEGNKKMRICGFSVIISDCGHPKERLVNSLLFQLAAVKTAFPASLTVRSRTVSARAVWDGKRNWFCLEYSSLSFLLPEGQQLYLQPPQSSCTRRFLSPSWHRAVKEGEEDCKCSILYKIRYLHIKEGMKAPAEL
ncbi:hypothetical protein MG293_012643 [Ovis ammon polii]|uniref:Uncharacterized protein n=1 Tax=Ovis ammon polii TaxID=230172 RepID=A0AAD4U561_OVIAM|nr:hypothetical protein MG293_012643 [Ovis ammon polii]